MSEEQTKQIGALQHEAMCALGQIKRLHFGVRRELVKLVWTIEKLDALDSSEPWHDIYDKLLSEEYAEHINTMRLEVEKELQDGVAESS